MIIAILINNIIIAIVMLLAALCIEAVFYIYLYVCNRLIETKKTEKIIEKLLIDYKMNQIDNHTVAMEELTDSKLIIDDSHLEDILDETYAPEENEQNWELPENDPDELIGGIDRTS